MRLRPHWATQASRPGGLLGRTKLQAGEGVMINGATGIAGKQPIQVAKHRGAAKTIATGRNEEALAALAILGANETIPLNQPEENLLRAFRSRSLKSRLFWTSYGAHLRN